MAYNIGNFTFETEEEYNKAQEEMKFINELKKEYNINDKEDATRVLEFLEMNNKTFETSIGDWFVKLLTKISQPDNVPLKGTPRERDVAGAGKSADKGNKEVSKDSVKYEKTPKAKAAKSAKTGTSANKGLALRVNILTVVVIILIGVTIYQQIMLMNMSNSSNNNSPQVTIGGDISGGNATNSDNKDKPEIKDVLELANYLGKSIGDIFIAYGDPDKTTDSDGECLYKSYDYRGFDGELAVYYDKDGYVKYFYWKTKRTVQSDPDKVLRLDAMYKDLTTAFDKYYSATSEYSWRTDFGKVDVTNSGADFSWIISK